jgi:hypothetical protein
MTFRTAGVVGLTAAAAAALAGATPAVAAPDCGPVPAGATLTILGGTTCQLDFAAAGSYSWTTPPTVQGLQALLLGGGAGAYMNTASGIGYAGNSGQLIYVDYSSASGGAPTTIVVGDGGASSADNTTGAGEDSSVTLSGAATYANGGNAVGSDNCDPEGSPSTDSGNGNGAGGGHGASTDCTLSYAPGLIPSIATTDSVGTARPAVFSDLATEFARGGRVLITADTLPADVDLDGLGIGANVHYDNGIDSFDVGNLFGGSGRVILRYSIGPALASTGVDAGLGLGVAGGLAAAGAVLLATSRRRTQA